MIWTLLKHFKSTESWGDPVKMDPLLLLLLDRIKDNLPQGSVIKIHCGYKANGESRNSLHYQGKAADFHVIGIDFLIAENLIMDYLHRTGIIEYIGLGIYPDWLTPGFHLDVRGKRTLWGQMNGSYVSYEDCLNYAKEKL